MCLQIDRRERHEHADVPQALVLLRRERRGEQRATEERDELASPYACAGLHSIGSRLPIITELVVCETARSTTFGLGPTQGERRWGPAYVLKPLKCSVVGASPCKRRAIHGRPLQVMRCLESLGFFRHARRAGLLTGKIPQCVGQITQQAVAIPRRMAMQHGATSFQRS